MLTCINDADWKHLSTFPSVRKAQLTQKIESTQASHHVIHQGGIHFTKTMEKIRRGGYRLIELQQYETAFNSVWVREKRSLFHRQVEVISLMWEHHERGESTSVTEWRFSL